MILRNARVLSADNTLFEQRDLYVRDGLIVPHDDGEVYDADGAFVLPGMIDTHIHGFIGEEFAKKDGGFDKALHRLAQDGVVGFAATVRCMPFEDMLACTANAAAHCHQPSDGAKVLGIHSEGPFVSNERRGAMYPPDIPCCVEAFEALADAADGQLRLMTIAPEREHACEVIAAAERRGVHASLGHTDATYAVATAAVDAGARRATHVFNAMRPLSHRETGILGAALTDDRVTCELIADFVHLDPAAVSLVYRMKGASRITLISDAGMMSGLPNGEYEVGGRIRTVKDGLCLDTQGRIAGSCFSMLKGAQNLRSLGIPLEDIAVMAAYNPAVALRVDDRYGSLAVGKQADFLLCDDRLHIRDVFINGRPL